MLSQQKGLPWGLGFCIPTIFLILLIVIRPSGFYIPRFSRLSGPLGFCIPRFLDSHCIVDYCQVPMSALPA